MSDSIKAKIAKLLQMTAERGCTEAEASVAMEKAQKLLLEHNLTEVDVLGASTENKDHREDDFLAYAWAKKVCCSIAKLYDCSYHERRSGRRNHFHSTFKGRQSNAETAKLIAQFVVRAILKLSRQAQKDAEGDNRYATDFQHGCADRVCVKALELWREANKEAIEAKQRANDLKLEAYNKLRPNFDNLPPGTYSFELLGKGWNTLKQPVELNEIQAVAYFNSLMKEEPPRGVYLVAIRCLSGYLQSDNEYYWHLRIEAAKKGRVNVQNKEAFEAGKTAGASIGLHVQVVAGPSNQLK